MKTCFSKITLFIGLLLAVPLCGLQTLCLAAEAPGLKKVMTDATAPAPVRTPKSVKVKKADREFKIFKPELNFSESPKDLDIMAARVFEEPLIAMSGESVPRENAALARALEKFKKREVVEDLSVLTAFLQKFPTSKWRASLELNKGLIEYQTGYFTAALNSWKSAWELSRDEMDPMRKTVGDRAIAEYLLLNAKIGRVTVLEEMMDELGDRKMEGSMEAKVSSAREGMVRMKTDPGVAFKCGPFAINSILYSDKKIKGRAKILEKARSSVKGTSLAQVKGWADQTGLKYQPAKRASGAEIIFPAVIHWKVGHFGAIIKEENGRYLVKDPTFGGGELWLTEKALEEEGSGYYLIPKGALPTGWQSVSMQEAATVWGRGGATGKAQDEKTPAAPQCATCPKGMAQASIFTSLATLHIADIPVFYEAPLGPQMNFQASYSHLETNQPSSFSFSNFGPAWSFNWLSYLKVDASQNVSVAVRGGGTEVYSYSQKDNVTNIFAPNVLSQAVLVLTSQGSYERRLPDGSKEVYDQPDSTGRIFLTKVVDPQGNAATIAYDGNFRVTSITDAIGLPPTTITYKSNTFGNAGYYKIYRITDPFGRYAQFDYDGAVNQLIRITDIIGITSDFTYDTGSFINSMTTPYGKTLFYSYMPEGISDAAGLKFTYADGTSQVVENWTHDSNTFFWDRKAWHLYPSDKTKAVKTRWLFNPDSNIQSSVPEYIKKPLEAKVTFTYPYQSESFVDGEGLPAHGYAGINNRPNKTVRILDDATEQIYRSDTNELGKVTRLVDPLGRTMNYSYAANGIDLLEVRQTRGSNNDLLGKWVYNSQHLPVSSMDASGRITIYSYNSQGQLLTVTNPKSEVATLTYYSSDVTSGMTITKQRKGRLQKIDGPLSGTSDSTTLDYDAYGRVRTVTDSEGYVLTYDYDLFDRVTLVTYPDGSYEQIAYDRLQAVFLRDRLGRWTQRSYDSLQQLVSEIDPLGRATGYAWCKCGSLAALTDAKGQVTTWDRDVQGRVTRKTFADSKHIDYVYENNISRLKTQTDATGQVQTYSYNLDNSLEELSYSNSTIATSTVNYTYDPDYLRLASVSNGWGTTSYAYNSTITGPSASPILGGGKLREVSNDVMNDSDIVFTYDELGRVTNRSINGSSNSLTWTYDAMGRVTAEAGPLGSFAFAYLNDSSGGTRPSSVTYPNGQVINYSYMDNNHDQRLEQIENLNASSAQISKFNYGYNVVGNITAWTQQVESGTALRYDLGYDRADQLTSGILKNDGTNAVIKQTFYGYDLAGNRSSEQINAGVSQASYNNVNQLTALSAGGPVHFEGTLDEPGTATVNGVAAQMKDPTHFVANPVLSVGSNNVTVTATDGSSNTRTNTYQVTVDAGTGRTITTDDNGNMISNGNGQTYYWDAQNRLVKIAYTAGGSSEFSYDGLGRRVKVVEKDGSNAVTSDKRYLWDGLQICEERDSSDVVIKRFFMGGVEVPAASSPANKLFYTKDHLGTIRELTDSSSVVRGRWDFDLYGRRSANLITSSALEADFAYTGHYFHERSGLALAPYRAYDANLGRWLARDPIGEAGGINLYGYVDNNSINGIDPTGLDRVVVDRGHAIIHVQNESGGWTGVEFGPGLGLATAVDIGLARAASKLGPLGLIAGYGMFANGRVYITENSDPDMDFGQKCRTKSSPEDDKVLLDFARELARQQDSGELSLPYGAAFNCRHFVKMIKGVGRNTPPKNPSLLDGFYPSVLK